MYGYITIHKNEITKRFSNRTKMLSGACLGLVCIGAGLQTFFAGEHQRRRLSNHSSEDQDQPLLKAESTNDSPTIRKKFIRTNPKLWNVFCENFFLTPEALDVRLKAVKLKSGSGDKKTYLLAIKLQRGMCSAWKIGDELEYVGLNEDPTKFNVNVKGYQDKWYKFWRSGKTRTTSFHSKRFALPCMLNAFVEITKDYDTDVVTTVSKTMKEFGVSKYFGAITLGYRMAMENKENVISAIHEYLRSNHEGGEGIPDANDGDTFDKCLRHIVKKYKKDAEQWH